MKYTLHKVKKQWLTITLTAMAGVVLLVGGANTVSADDQSVTDQPTQTLEQVQDDEATVTSDQSGASESQLQQTGVPQADSATVSQEQQTAGQDTTEASQNLQASTTVTDVTKTSDQSVKQVEVTPVSQVSVQPATDGAVVESAPSQTAPTQEGQNDSEADLVQGVNNLDSQAIVTTALPQDINKVIDGHSSGISTLDAAALTLEFEKARLRGATDATILEEIQKDGRAVPNNLTYLSDFYDARTGTSGAAFRDKASQKVIVAYTGTNNDGNELQDALGADLIGIGLARGQHYQPAYDFYDKIARQYGAENIVVTGHSLGGNVAQRVALKKNVATTVVYNAAPLYIPSVASVGNKIYDSLRKVFDLPSNREEAKQTIADIKADMKTFTGQVTRITTQKDWLNNAMRLLGAVYLGTEYIIPNSGNHDLQAIANDSQQVASVKAQVSL